MKDENKFFETLTLESWLNNPNRFRERVVYGQFYRFLSVFFQSFLNAWINDREETKMNENKITNVIVIPIDSLRHSKSKTFHNER